MQIKEYLADTFQFISTHPIDSLKIATPYLLGIGALAIVGNVAGIFHEYTKNRKLEKTGVLLEILVKKTTPAKATEEMIRNIHSLLLNTSYREWIKGRPYMSFEVVATEKKIMFYIWVPKGYSEVIMELIYSTYPECAIREAECDYLEDRTWPILKDYISYFKARKKGEQAKLPKKHVNIHGTEMELAYHHVLSLNKNLNKEDLLPSLISGMKNLEFHDKVAMQVIVRPLSGKWQHKGRSVLEKYEKDGVRPTKNGQIAFSFKSIIDEMFGSLEDELQELGFKRQSVKKTRYDRKEITVATDKIMDAGFETIIRLMTVSHFDQGAKTRLKVLGAAFSELDKENKMRRKFIYNKKLFYRRFKNRRVYLRDQSNIMTPGELSKFFLRLPGEELIDQHPEIQALKVKEFAPPQNVETEQLIIGINTFRGKETPIGIKFKDLVRHMIVEGATGTGKSEWAKYFFKQLMEIGLGGALFEPHGKMAKEVLMDIPEHRRKDVIMFDLLDDFPPPFNFCKIKEVKGQRQEHVTEKLAKEIIQVNKKQFAEAWSGKNAYYLENAIKTVIELKSGNYVDIRRLFSDKEFRKYAIANLKDPQLIHFWKNEFAENAKGELSAGTQSTVNSVDYKLGSFLNSKSLLRAVGQDDCIDFKEVLDQNKILIFRFDKERMSEDQISFIGSIAIKLLVVESFRRDKSMWNKPFTIFIDEAQNFVDEDTETMLTECRKYGLSLVMMHQMLSQMNKVKGLLDAIYNNVGTKITFTTGEPDAPFFEKVFAPRLDQSDLIRLPSRYGYIKMLVDGVKSETFNIKTVDNPKLDKEESIKCYKEILHRNRVGRLNYKDLDKMIAQRMIGVIDDNEDRDYYESDDLGTSNWGEAIVEQDFSWGSNPKEDDELSAYEEMARLSEIGKQEDEIKQENQPIESIKEDQPVEQKNEVKIGDLFKEKSTQVKSSQLREDTDEGEDQNLVSAKPVETDEKLGAIHTFFNDPNKEIADAYEALLQTLPEDDPEEDLEEDEVVISKTVSKGRRPFDKKPVSENAEKTKKTSLWDTIE